MKQLFVSSQADIAAVDELVRRFSSLACHASADDSLGVNLVDEISDAVYQEHRKSARSRSCCQPSSPKVAQRRIRFACAHPP